MKTDSLNSTSLVGHFCHCSAH